jgi:pilus assembly protein CpaE
MLSAALFTDNKLASAAIQQMIEESGLYRLNVKMSPFDPMGEAVRQLRTHNPEVILLDLTHWEEISKWVARLAEADFKIPIVGFRENWNRRDAADFEEAGIEEVLKEPFSASELEAAVYHAVHRAFPVHNPELHAFLPAKAGSGCSTLTLHLAAFLAGKLQKKVLLIEADRRSGVLSILLHLETRASLDGALKSAAQLTPLDWAQHYVEVEGFHLLPATPMRRGPLPTWVDYYHLLRFVNSRYDCILVDLPEVVNSASAEVVRAAGNLFVVCTPEVPSLKMAEFRRSELLECEIEKEQINLVLNRWERRGLSLADVEKSLGQGLFGTIPNEYATLQDAILESRLAPPDGTYQQAVGTLARRVAGLPPPTPRRSAFALLGRLGRRAAE